MQPFVEAELRQHVTIRRERYWDKVRNFIAMRRAGEAPAPILFVGGLGGAGKTTLATKDALQREQDDDVLFIHVQIPDDPDETGLEWKDASWANKLKQIIDCLQDAGGRGEDFPGFFEFYDRAVSRQDSDALARQRQRSGIVAIVFALGVIVNLLQIPGVPLPENDLARYALMALFAAFSLGSLFSGRFITAIRKWKARHDLKRVSLRRSILTGKTGEDEKTPLKPDDFPENDVDTVTLTNTEKYALDRVLTDMLRLGLRRWLARNGKRHLAIMIDIQKVPPAAGRLREDLRDLINRLAVGSAEENDEGKDPLDNRLSLVVLSQFSAFPEANGSTLHLARDDPEERTRFDVMPFSQEEAWNYTCQAVLRLEQGNASRSGSAWILSDLARYVRALENPDDAADFRYAMRRDSDVLARQAAALEKLRVNDARATLETLAFGHEGSDLLALSVRHRIVSLFEYLDDKPHEQRNAQAALREKAFVGWVRNFLGQSELNAATGLLGERKFQNADLLLSIAALAAFEDTHPDDAGVSGAIWTRLNVAGSRLLDLDALYTSTDLVSEQDGTFRPVPVARKVITANGLHWRLLDQDRLLEPMQLSLMRSLAGGNARTAEEKLARAHAIMCLCGGYISRATAEPDPQAGNRFALLSKVRSLDEDVREAIEKALEEIRHSAASSRDGDDLAWRERCQRILQKAAIACCGLIRPEAASGTPEPVVDQNIEDGDEGSKTDSEPAEIQDWLSAESDRLSSSLASLRCIADYLALADVRSLEERDRLSLIAARSRILAFVNAHPEQVREKLAEDIRRGFRRLEHDLVDYGTALALFDDPDADFASLIEAAEIVHDARKRIAATGMGERMDHVFTRLRDAEWSGADTSTSLRALTIWRKIANSLANKKVIADLKTATTAEARIAAVSEARESYILPLIDRTRSLASSSGITPEEHWTLNWVTFQALLYWLEIVARQGATFDSNVLDAMKSAIAGMTNFNGAPSANLIQKMKELTQTSETFDTIVGSEPEMTRGLFDDVPDLLSSSIADYLDALVTSVEEECSAAFAQQRDIDRATWCKLISGLAHSAVPELEEHASPAVRERASAARKRMRSTYARAMVFRISRFNNWRAGLSVEKQDARLNLAIERFSSFEMSESDQQGFARAFMEYIVAFTPSREELTPRSLIAAKIARLDHKIWSFTPFASDFRIQCRTTLLPSAIYIAQNGLKDGTDTPKHAELRDQLRDNLLLTSALHFDAVDRPRQFAVTAKGAEYIAQLFYIFGLISSVEEAIAPAFGKRDPRTLDNGTLWMGGSNTFAVLRLRSDMMTALLRMEGHLVKKLRAICYLRDITLFSAEPEDSIEQQMRHFTSKRFRDLRLVRKENHQIEFYTNSTAIDNRKNLTFLKLFEKIFGEMPTIQGWALPEKWRETSEETDDEDDVSELEDA